MKHKFSKEQHTVLLSSDTITIIWFMWGLFIICLSVLAKVSDPMGRVRGEDLLLWRWLCPVKYFPYWLYNLMQPGRQLWVWKRNLRVRLWANLIYISHGHVSILFCIQSETLSRFVYLSFLYILFFVSPLLFYIHLFYIHVMFFWKWRWAVLPPAWVLLFGS